ncbi:MAG: EamA family transporter [Candidatus Bathyarchaeota archaeon]|nr:EamA family transporter [Candidatus Bathyarchaeota archaeon]
MEWFIFALLCPAFLGLNSIFDKFLMTKKFQSYFSMLSYLTTLDLIFVAVIYLVTPISFNYPYALIGMAGGLLPLLAFWFYSKALMVEEISRITPLIQTIPIFVVFLSYFFLNENLVGQSYFGILVMVIASILISHKKTKTGNQLSSALKFIVPYNIVSAVDIILNKYLLGYLDYWSVIFWGMLGSFFGVLVLLTFSKPRKEFMETVPTIGKRTFFVTLVGEGVYFLGDIFWLIAASLGNVSLVSALAGLEPFFVFGFMLILSMFMPKILEEEVNKEVVLLKIVAIALMFIGTFLITT